MRSTHSMSLGRALALGAMFGALLVPGVGRAEPLPVPPEAVGARPGECPGGALKSHAPVAIAAPTDFTPDNGVTGGSGTPDDPWVISCWAIDVPDNATTGINVSGAAAAVPFIIRDVHVTGHNQRGRGIVLSGGPASALIEHNTVEGLNQSGIVTQSSGSVTVTANLARANNMGFQDSTPGVLITGNRGEANTQVCINRSGGAGGKVVGNTCANNVGGAAFGLQGSAANPLEAYDNVAEDNENRGFALSTGVHAHDNVARRNDTGIAVTAGGNVAEHNTARDNTLDGFDITTSIGNTIRDNTIVHNGRSGIMAFAIQGAVPVHRNQIEGNHIGWNPFGIALLYMNNSNVVESTDWLDGHPSYIRFANTNSVVDAGSDYGGVPGEATRFHDWIAIAVVGGSGQPTNAKEVNVVTGAAWDFGDGSPPQPLTPAAVQGQVPPDDVTHVYQAPGEYTATLTVTGLNNLNEPVEFTDTTTVTIGDPGPAGLLPLPDGHEPWPSLGNDPARTFYNGAENTITPENVGSLDVKWRFPTTEPVTATPAVATIDIGGEPTEAVFDGSYSGTMYALRASNGSPLWINCLIESAPGEAPQPEPFCDPQSPQQNPNDPNAARQQAYGAIVDSPAVAKVALPGGVTEDRVFVGVGGANTHMVALNANTGDERWRFTAAYSAPTYSVSGSPVVIGDTVLFGMDCNNRCDYGGGIFAVSAVDGTMKWFWDVASGANFVAPPGTTTFDPGQMRGTPPAAISRDCGAVWSSPAIDVELGLAFVGTADCLDVPMADHEEAVVALDLQTGAPVWRFQPRQIDQKDMDFGATPNVFTIGGRHVVGAGGKDGTYYALDAQTGDEIWSTKLALGGNFGGFYGTAVDGERIYLTNAIGEASDTFVAGEERLRGTEFALDARTGNVEWIQHLGSPSVGMNTASPGIYWTGGLDHQLHAWDAASGNPLGTWNVGGAASSAPAIANGHVYVGAGTGATYRAAVGDGDPLGVFEGETGQKFPHPIPVSEYGQGIYSFCLTSEPDCAASRADPESAKRRTAVTYNGVKAGPTTDEVTVSATLRDAIVEPHGFPIEGAQLTFSLGGESCTATTAAPDGTASCALRVDGAAGASTVKTSFAGDDLRRASDDFDDFLIGKELTALSYTGSVQLTNTESVELGASLTEDDGAAIGDAEVTFTIGDQSCTATTGGGGNAGCDIELDQPVGAATVVAEFAGDDRYEPAQVSAPVTIVSPSTGGPGPGPDPGGECPAENSSAELGADQPVAGGGAAAGASIGFPFVRKRFGRGRGRGKGKGTLLPLAVAGAVMALTLAGCGFGGGPSPTPGC